jgi:NitT/TauT family transport system ATP-binding protein
MTSRSAITVDALSLVYDGGIESRQIFTDVSFSVDSGEVLGIFGPNGCGKTSLLRCIAGLLQPQSGSVCLSDRRDGLAVSLIPQDFSSSFFQGISLRRNLDWMVPGCEVYANRLLKEARYDLNLGLRANQCSGGMLQLTAIIRALAAEPLLILGDEPFSALDANVSRRVKDVFLQTVRKSGTSAILVLHNLEDVVDVCDRVLVVPSRPFSTAHVAATSQAVFLENRNLPKGLANSSFEQTFVEIARRVLEPDAAKQ